MKRALFLLMITMMVGAAFSARQKETFRKLARNRRFYVSRVTVVGPDGLTRTLQNPMEVIVK